MSRFFKPDKWSSGTRATSLFRLERRRRSLKTEKARDTKKERIVRPRRRFATINQKVSGFRSAYIVLPLKPTVLQAGRCGFHRKVTCNRRTVEKLFCLTENPLSCRGFRSCTFFLSRLLHNHCTICVQQCCRIPQSIFFLCRRSGALLALQARWWKSFFLNIILQVQTKTQHSPRRHQGTVNIVHFLSFL